MVVMSYTHILGILLSLHHSYIEYCQYVWHINEPPHYVGLLFILCTRRLKLRCDVQWHRCRTKMQAVYVQYSFSKRFASFSVYFWTVWGLRVYNEIWRCGNIAMGLVYPLSEHVDIFPVRPVSTFPLLLSVYLIQTIYLTWSSFILSGGIKDKGWILFLLSIKIHYIFISDMERSTIVITAYIMTIPSSPCRNCGKVLRWY